MPEPILSPAAATLGAATAAIPTIVAFGVNLGLRPDILVAGFAGALAGIVLLNTVPNEGDTWQHLLRTTARRIGVVMTSALVAGYMTPVVLPETTSLAVFLGVAFAVGAGAQKFLRKVVDKLEQNSNAKGGV
jgi:uncharacterized membrane protein